MPGDPHPRSAHRASPAGGLTLLNPQALVRQAQARQARARQAIIRQAVARRARGRRAADRQARGGSARDEQAWELAAQDEAAQLKFAQFEAAQFAAAQFAAAHFRGAHLASGPVGRGAEAPAIPRHGPGHPTVARPAAPQHRQPRTDAARQRGAPRRRAPREPQRALQTLMRGLGALIVLAIVGLSAFFVIAEERRGGGRESAVAAGSEPGIASREIDAEPLTQGEVFPEPTVRLAAGDAGYQVTMTHSDSVCRIATTGELGALLDDYGCDQVVRGRLTAPYGGYLVTAGIFNLADESGAAQVSELAGTLVETGRGTFTTFGGSAGDPLAEPLAQVGWRNRGHYLLYCAIARPDGQLVADDDPYAARITAEVVERYLGEQVVGRRTLDP